MIERLEASDLHLEIIKKQFSYLVSVSNKLRERLREKESCRPNPLFYEIQKHSNILINLIF